MRLKNKFLIIILLLIIVCVVATYFLYEKYNELAETAKVHQESIIKNIENYTSNDCPKLTMMNVILKDNQFGQLANEVIEDKIQVLDCLSYEEYKTNSTGN